MNGRPLLAMLLNLSGGSVHFDSPIIRESSAQLSWRSEEEERKIGSKRGERHMICDYNK